MNKNVYTIAELTAKEGKLHELQTILTELAQETRKESGAIEYFFILDEQKTNTILSYEKWSDAQQESSHWKTPHLTAAIEKMGEVLENEPVIHKGSRII